MSKNLVIVESPAKAGTIKKFLGKDFDVTSSMGHIRDLPAKSIGIDIEHDFEPLYELLSDKTKIISELKKMSKDAEIVWLATDEDREGEAISWHLKETLKLSEDKIKRIAFHEITKDAVLKAIENPRSIDVNLVNAQQARRVLDRLVGFELSPVLWRKVKPSLSAGRVQSVAVKLIVEKEKEINAFQTQSSYRVIGDFCSKANTNHKLTAELNRRFTEKEEALSFLHQCQKAQYKISAVQKSPAKKSPAAPFTTSTLQQEASRKLGFSVSRTMTVAQQLYEAGYITYMRTDSVNLSNMALASAKEEILKLYGKAYSKPRNYQTKSKGAQEAHEAIRPTYMDRQDIKMDAAAMKLYQLIWKRTIASQMSDALLEKTTIDIEISNQESRFMANGELLQFDGFLKLYIESKDDEEEETKTVLPNFVQGEVLNYIKIEANQRYTQMPVRYSEASLVRKLEELGIGRPSTYAPIISTIQKRAYVVKANKESLIRDYVSIVMEGQQIQETSKTEKYGYEKDKLSPTDIGTIVNQYLVDNFEKIMDYNFTAKVEANFDKIAAGKLVWNKMIQIFYKDFHQTVNYAMEHTSKASGTRLLGIDPVTKQNIYVKLGRFGPMVQKGENDADSTEKPLFARLKKEQSIETITLEEALKLFLLPKNLGKYENEDIVVGIGRFGPFIHHNNQYYSVYKNIEPTTITYEDAIELISKKRQENKDKAPRIVGMYKDLEVASGVGRFGPYVKYNGKYYALPKTTNIADVMLNDAIELIEQAKEKNVIKRYSEDDSVVVMKGRFGDYIAKDGVNYKIPKDYEAEKLTFSESLSIIQNTKSKKNTHKTSRKTSKK